MSQATKQLDNIFKRLESAVDETIKPAAMKTLGEFIANIIKKRTLLGYGVKKDFGTKEKLKGFTSGYRAFRKYAPDKGVLAGSTSVGKSNLTLTGQMLESYGTIKVSKSMVSVGVKGSRRTVGFLKGRGLTNKQIAAYQEEQGRIFNRLSQLEFQQALRLYRKTFGDLLLKKRLIS